MQPALQASGESLALNVGADIEVHSLQKSPELNGVHGMIVEAATWLQMAYDAGCWFASLHLALLALDEGQEDRPLAHLKDYLSILLRLGRNLCAG